MNTYKRFEKYVRINTQSDDNSGLHPSFSGEYNLAKLLADELKELKLENVTVTDQCYVYAFCPASKGYENANAIGFIAHMDTAPDASGENVELILHKDYDGGDVEYPAIKKFMKVSDFPFLAGFKGETLITSNGTTLLGSDDKAGVAEIMAAIEFILENNIEHGPIYIAFTPDEEIGEGADAFDLDIFKAKYAYTVDGGDVDTIEYENFNAAAAIVTVKGFSVHPGEAKGKMINSSLVAMEYDSLLPDEKPENTELREGFYHLTNMKGRCESAELSYIIRDHDKDKFEERKKVMQSAADKINAKYGDGTVSIEITDSYYNMLEKILPHMHLVENAKKAICSVGYEAKEVPIRGGTDGARLSFMGLPCPNLGTGGYNFHGPFELNSIERMDKAAMIIVELIKIYKDYVN